MKTIVVDGLTVMVERKPIQKMYLRLKKPDGHVTVTCPTGVSDRAVADFVREKRRWIDTHQAQIQARPELQPHAYVTGERFFLWGKPWTLEVRPTQRGQATLAARDGILRMTLPPGAEEQAGDLIDAWYRRQMKMVVPPLLNRCQARTELTVSRWQVRKMTSRWGSCRPSTKSITLNLNLAAYPPECLEMVIYHELTHLLEANHGPRFYAHLERFCPDWRRADAILKGKSPMG